MSIEKLKCDLYVTGVSFEVRCEKEAEDLCVISLFAVTSSGERFITSDHHTICFILDCSPSFLTALKDGEVIKIF